MSRRIKVTRYQAYLFAGRGERMARKYFGEQATCLGRYSKGKYRGKLRGQVQWEKVTSVGETRIMYSSDLSERYAPECGDIIRVRLMTWPWKEKAKTVTEWLYGDPVFETETEEETT